MKSRNQTDPDLEDLAKRYADGIRVLRLPAGLQGAYYRPANLILLSDLLTPIQRRCVLAHELSHAKHSDSGCSGSKHMEERADMEAASWLVNPVEYQAAEAVCDGDLYAIARELGLTCWIVQAYRRYLHACGYRPAASQETYL